MSNVEAQVVRARRRLNANVAMNWLARGVLIATALWTLLLLIQRLFALNLPVGPALWGAAVVALVITLVGTWRGRVSPLAAAVQVDEAAGLKERLSTALLVRSSSDPFAKLAVQDAETQAARVPVPACVRLRAPEIWPWSAAAVVSAALLALFFPQLDLLGDDPTDNQELRAAARRERLAIEQDLEVRLNKIREMARENEALQDLARDLESLKLPDDPGLTPEDVRREAAKRIDNVAERLAQEKEADRIAALQEARRMLARMEPQPGQDAASRFSQALSQGDFQAARQALAELQKQLQEAAAGGDLQARQQAAELERRLKRLADQLARLEDGTYLRKELENKAGLSEDEARELVKKLSQLDGKQLEKELQRQLADKNLSQEQLKELVKKFQKRQQASKMCRNMGQCLSQAAQALAQAANPGQGNSGAQDASGALADLADQLSELEMAEQTLNELDAQLADLQDMRDSVCQGGYCNKPGPSSDNVGSQGPNQGLGIGSRIGKQRTAHALTPTKVKSRSRGGTIIGQRLVDGPVIRGQATAEVRETVLAAEHEAQEALDRDRVPRQYHKAVQAYFERLAGLVRAADAGPPGERSAPTTQP